MNERNKKKQKLANSSYFGDEIAEEIANSFGMCYDHVIFISCAIFRSLKEVLSQWTSKEGLSR
jgi:hypothetical protein